MYTSKKTDKGNVGLSLVSQDEADERARLMDAGGNINCTNCHGCTNCYDCIHCNHCHGCTGINIGENLFEAKGD